MKTNKPFIIKLSNSQEMELPWDEWNQKWTGHVCYWDNVGKMNDPVLGVNAVANAVSRSAKGNAFGVSLDNFMLTINVYDFKAEV